MYNKNTKRYNKKEGNPVQNFKLKKKEFREAYPYVTKTK